MSEALLRPPSERAFFSPFLPRIRVPASINSRLLEHQREVAKFLYSLYKNNHRGILGDDMFCRIHSLNYRRRMANGILFNTVKGIIKSLGSLAAEETKLLWGVEDEEDKYAVNPAVRDWVGKLNDIIDFAGKKACIFFLESDQLAYGFKMDYNIKVTRERLDAFGTDRKFLVVERHVEKQIRDRDKIHSFVYAEVSSEDEEVLIELLMDLNIKENVSISLMVGIGGFGKITLQFSHHRTSASIWNSHYRERCSQMQVCSLSNRCVRFSFICISSCNGCGWKFGNILPLQEKGYTRLLTGIAATLLLLPILSNFTMHTKFTPVCKHIPFYHDWSHCYWLYCIG